MSMTLFFRAQFVAAIGGHLCDLSAGVGAHSSGLGTGLSSLTMRKRGIAIDIVDPDEALSKAVEEHFNLKTLTSHEENSKSTMSPQLYVDQVAAFNREVDGAMQKWAYVLHDLGSVLRPRSVYAAGGDEEGAGGSLAAYTKEFWAELTDLVEPDGIVTVVGPPPSFVREVDPHDRSYLVQRQLESSERY